MGEGRKLEAWEVWGAGVDLIISIFLLQTKSAVVLKGPGWFRSHLPIGALALPQHGTHLPALAQVSLYLTLTTDGIS